MKRKNLDLTEDCIKEIAKEAIDKGTDFKNLSQDILEAHAKNIKTLDNRVENIIDKIIRPMLRDEVDSDDMQEIRNSILGILS